MPTLKSLVTEFLEDRAAEGLSKHSVSSYSQALTHFTAYMGPDTDPSEVTRRDIKGFLADRRAKGEAVTTLANRHASLSVFWSWLIEEEEVSDNVVKKVTRPREKVKPVPLVSAEDMSALLKIEARTPFLTVRNRCILHLLYDTGIRVGELCNLKLDDIDFDTQMLTVRGKTGERTIPFGKTCSVALRRYIRRRQYHPGSGSDRVFIGSKGSTQEGTVLHMIREYGKRAGIGKIYPHMFRHSYVDSMLSAGATVLDVQYLCGHASPQQIMNRYGIAGKRDRAILAHRRLSPGDRLNG
ncbi:tyrosine-type recombinase/integrase [Streptomonospora sp. PA3]|uniref:tyrosine-type recombinase/integrase n=1 Tax=Streptomonospora sp. PA3 TaxID=2607326 RepID=UPI0012DDAFD8